MSHGSISSNQICNNNPANIPSDDSYDAFNRFIFSGGNKLLGKLLHRFDFFQRVKDLPGDIVEIGVFKGSGVATFSKFIDIFCPNSNKKVIGFDIFDVVESKSILKKDTLIDQEAMNVVYTRVDSNELTLENVNRRLSHADIPQHRYHLVKGDVETTLPQFINENPGFRISMLYIDVDIDRPTYCALKYLWDRILPGGVILFDEYEYHKFSESVGVDKFLQEFNIPYNIKSTQYIAPTAYMFKK